MRLIDADELKKCAIPCEIHNGALTDLCVPLYQIDNAPTFTPKVEFVTINGITFPKALETMTFSHELTTEERQNIERAYMLGVYSNERPQGEWLWLCDSPDPKYKWSCNKCGRGVKEQENFCPNCGAKMRGTK